MTDANAKALDLKAICQLSVGENLCELDSKREGLSSYEGAARLRKYGTNEIGGSEEQAVILQFLSRFVNPLVISLLIVSAVSMLLGQTVSAIIVIAMAVLSVILSFIQEYHASKNAKKLQEMVKISVRVCRDGKVFDLSAKNLVPGDVVELTAGKMIPADLRILEAKDLYVSQSALNGESFPVIKQAEKSEKKIDTIFDEQNIAFMGSNVVSGTAVALVVATGHATEFGKLSKELTKKKADTGFDRGIRDFTWLMIRLIVILGIFIFVSSAIFKGGNLIESLLFALAVAIGLAPEMLPMIVTINLSKGAIDMSKKKVIIKELDSIQNFGAMDVLCTDKTGTLTLDNVALVKYSDVDNKPNERIFELAYLNSHFQSGLENILDRAVLDYKKINFKEYDKVDEIPFDFNRRMMSVIVRRDHLTTIITKGAPESILKICSSYLLGDKKEEIHADTRRKLEKIYDDYSKDGFRVLALAYKDVEFQHTYESDGFEKDLVFAGFIAFLDPPKPTAEAAIREMKDLGIDLKVLSGDNEFVTEKICRDLNIVIGGVLTGVQIEKMNKAELARAADSANVFCRLNPMQKELIVQALQRNGHVVGFIGDGINDAPALAVADVGISVNNATDVTKETAQIILLEKDLGVLGNCVIEGRKTFANVIKYIKMGASSNFGNMLSMTGASVFLPFLPMLSTQVLLNNFLYDLSQIAIPTDDVDAEYLKRPRPWNIDFVKKFIIWIGPISSIYDFLTFGIMLFVFHASEPLFHTGWFIESLTTQILVVHIIRTNKIPFIESRPSKILLFSTSSILLFAFILPYTYLGKLLGFVPLPFLFFVLLIFMAATYLLFVQFVKNIFTKKFGYE